MKKLKISHEICNNGVIMVSRNSIVEHIKACFEEDSYQRLLFRLNEVFETRFIWATKDDNWLWLDTLV